MGSHCCKIFSQAGWNVVVFDTLSTGWRDFSKWGELIIGDLVDREAIFSAIRKTKPDAVAHFAALSIVSDSIKKPDLYYRNNVTGSINLFDAMTSSDIKKLVFSSTCATYGIPKYLPIDEFHPQDPINTYGRNKHMIEQILQDYSYSFGLQSVSLRYFNAAGADPDGEIGERHEPETHLIPLALRGAGSADYLLKIFGTDYDTRDGSAIRDYIHVNDLADAHLRALSYLENNGKTMAINLETGTGTSVLEIKDSVARITGKKVNYITSPPREGDAPSLVAEPKLAKKVLGWEPNASNVDRIIKDAWRWHLAEMNRKKPA